MSLKKVILITGLLVLPVQAFAGGPATSDPICTSVVLKEYVNARYLSKDGTLVLELRVAEKEQICPFGRGEIYIGISQKVVQVSENSSVNTVWLPAQYMATDQHGRIVLERGVVAYSMMNAERFPLESREIIIELDSFNKIHLQLN